MKSQNTLTTLWRNAVDIITKPFREMAAQDAQILDAYKQKNAAKEQVREELTNAFRTSLANNNANAATEGGTADSGIKVLEAAQAILNFEEAELSKNIKREMMIQTAIRSGC